MHSGTAPAWELSQKPFRGSLRLASQPSVVLLLVVRLLCGRGYLGAAALLLPVQKHPLSYTILCKLAQNFLKEFNGTLTETLLNGKTPHYRNILSSAITNKLYVYEDKFNWISPKLYYYPKIRNSPMSTDRKQGKIMWIHRSFFVVAKINDVISLHKCHGAHQDIKWGAACCRYTYTHTHTHTHTGNGYTHTTLSERDSLL